MSTMDQDTVSADSVGEGGMSAGTRAVRVALPRGELRTPVDEHLRTVDFVVDGYGSGARTYRFGVEGRDGIEVRVFSDQDIPIQVALGNYDIGIASRTWVDELIVRHRLDSVVPLRQLDVPSDGLVAAGLPGSSLQALAEGVIRVATEYPNITQHFLAHARVPDYRLFEVWAQAEAWPPQDAELAVAPRRAVEKEGLEVYSEVHQGGVWLIANREALAGRDLSAALQPLLRIRTPPESTGLVVPEPLPPVTRRAPAPVAERSTFRIAVPDGHAQRHTVAALADAGIRFPGYEPDSADRYPDSGRDDVQIKVMRPQDMPRAVALGQVDLALTGRDWLRAFVATFPGAPVVELCDLKRSKYRLGAVVTEDLPIETIEEAIAYWRRDDPERPIRVASEYVSLADEYARARHLGRYQVIPISGASEGFVPEDAEILIEGTETGTTLRANRLTMIDVIMESTNCAIGSTERPDGLRGALRDDFVERLARAADAVAVE